MTKLLRTNAPGAKTLSRQFPRDAYIGLALKIDEDRVMKKAKVHSLEDLSESEPVQYTIYG